jgi:heat shock protein HslJ
MSIALILLAATVTFSGCTGGQLSAGPATTASPDPRITITGSPVIPPGLAGDWILTTMAIQGGTQVIRPVPEITLWIGQGSVLNGYDGCSNYDAPFQLTGTTTPYGSGIAIGPVQVPQMDCASNANEVQMYRDILGRTMAFAADPGKLVLTADSGDSLVFERPSLIPTTIPPPY